MSAQHAPTTPVTTLSGKLINIDNGGTLTDICVVDGERVYRTKTLTTPHDLSQCLFDGLKKASAELYGHEDVQSLLLSTQAIRYSTTQGTNALVERKGPRLGLVLGGGLTQQHLLNTPQAISLLKDLVDSRVMEVDAELDGTALESAVTRAVNTLSSHGANRIVLSFSGAQRDALETHLKRHLLVAFPPHMLGAVPLLFAGEIASDTDDMRRTWTAITNAFLHPAMERFLYSAEHRLHNERAQTPLLVFRNDGYSGRVAKTIAIKTYSSGPRGGMEGAKALAAHYGFTQLLSMDVGGTTTDIGCISSGAVRSTPHGKVEGVETSFPLCDVVSVGVGGSSIIRVVDAQIVVGPDSVGSAPGPACFNLGGTQATITDAFLLMGLLDSGSFFGGALQLSLECARAAVLKHVAIPLGVTETQALLAMEQAWVSKVAQNLRDYVATNPDTTLAAFGGAGPLVACRIAQTAGISRIFIPALAPVFSAFGIAFSDVGHSFSQNLDGKSPNDVATAMKTLREKAERAIFSENTLLQDCKLLWSVEATANAITQTHDVFDGRLPQNLPTSATLSLQLTVIKPIAHVQLSGKFGPLPLPAATSQQRVVQIEGVAQPLALYRVEALQLPTMIAGPAVLEEAFYTCRIDAAWQCHINGAGDILLTRI